MCPDMVFLRCMPYQMVNRDQPDARAVGAGQSGNAWSGPRRRQHDGGEEEQEGMRGLSAGTVEAGAWTRRVVRRDDVQM